MGELTSAREAVYQRGMSRRIDAEVVIVGGRPAGASLALRLGRRGKRVVILDKATFPSPPAVPSCPILYAPAMRLLDELGIDEARYADEGAKIAGIGFELEGRFKTTIDIPLSSGRSHAMGLDRASFDALLWDELARFPTIERRSGCTFQRVLRDERGVVTGITASDAEGPLAIHAPLSVGADGRFSAFARATGAEVREDLCHETSTVHFADWEGLRPFEPGREQLASLCTGARGATVLFFPAPRGRTMVATYLRADRASPLGDVEAHYQGVLDRFSGVRRRLEGARRVSEVVGVKRVQNRLLEPRGPGWALVGDALHHKDPIDGQGIYDALLSAKLLDENLERLDRYAEQVIAAMRPMMLATVKRVKQELYDEPPALILRTLIRWLMTDPEYQRRFMLFLTREEPPETWPPASLVRGAALRGMARDLRGVFSRR
jgi:2-polyprenyl-6-methoxyphenol hydroxylase-like FAD-dependent oxidoreductase